MSKQDGKDRGGCLNLNAAKCFFLLVLLLIFLLCRSAHGQSRADVGLHLAGDKDLGYQSVAAGLTGRVLFDLSVLSIDAGGEWVFHAPKVGENVGGSTLFTDVLVRRRIIGTIYVVGGIDVNKLSSFLLDATTTAAVTGVGFQVWQLRFQGVYEPPDFTSGQSVTRYRVEIEYTRPIGKSFYLSFKPQATIQRFDKQIGPPTLTANRFGMTISGGRFF
jgi:hypothetical protein